MQTVALLLNLAVSSLQNLLAIQTLIQKANAENRDVTPAEVDALFGTYDIDRAQLMVHIAAAKAAGK